MLTPSQQGSYSAQEREQRETDILSVSQRGGSTKGAEGVKASANTE